MIKWNCLVTSYTISFSCELIEWNFKNFQNKVILIDSRRGAFSVKPNDGTKMTNVQVSSRPKAVKDRTKSFTPYFFCTLVVRYSVDVCGSALNLKCSAESSFTCNVYVIYVEWQSHLCCERKNVLFIELFICLIRMEGKIQLLLPKFVGHKRGMVEVFQTIFSARKLWECCAPLSDKIWARTENQLRGGGGAGSMEEENYIQRIKKVKREHRTAKCWRVKPLHVIYSIDAIELYARHSN